MAMFALSPCALLTYCSETAHIIHLEEVSHPMSIPHRAEPYMNNFGLYSEHIASS